MGQIENSRTVGDAVPQFTHAVDVLLVVSPRRANELRVAADHTANGCSRTACHGAVAIRHGRPYLENVANTVAEARAIFDELLQQFAHLALRGVDALLDQQPAVDDHAAGIRYHGSRISGCFRLPAVN